MTQPLPLYFNGKFYSGGIHCGVHRVADRLIRECDALLAAMPDGDRPKAVLLAPEDADWVPPLDIIERRNQPRTSQLWEQFILPTKAADGVLINLANLAPVAHRRKVMMVHDAQFRFPDCGYSLRLRLGYRWLVPAMARSSRAVLTVSEYSRRMLHLFGIADEEHTRVVPNGGDHILSVTASPALRTRLGLEDRSYVLLFGPTNPHKNIQVVLKAFADGAMDPTRLVIVGPELEQLKAAGLPVPEGAVHAGRPTDGELRGLMAGALALAFPSRTEGFGLPLVEAMLSGCPVVASPAGAIPEVCGDAALYAGVDDPAGWRDAFRTLRSDPWLRECKIVKGHQRASRFTWRAAGEQLMDVVMEVAGQR